MASTVSQILAKFSERYPDCPQTTQMQMFLDADRELCTRLQLRNDVQTVSFALNPSTPGQCYQDYALPIPIYRVHSAYVLQSAGYQYPLWERSTDELDIVRWGWRNTTIGTPFEYYLSAQVAGNSGVATIGFYPIPTVPTNAGYPLVNIYSTSHVDLSTGDVVPEQLLTDNFYLFRMYALWSSKTDPSQYDSWDVRAEREFHRNHEHVQNMQSKGTTMIFPAAAFMPGRIR